MLLHSSTFLSDSTSLEAKKGLDPCGTPQVPHLCRLSDAELLRAIRYGRGLGETSKPRPSSDLRSHDVLNGAPYVTLPGCDPAETTYGACPAAHQATWRRRRPC